MEITQNYNKYYIDLYARFQEEVNNFIREFESIPKMKNFDFDRENRANEIDVDSILFKETDVYVKLSSYKTNYYKKPEVSQKQGSRVKNNKIGGNILKECSVLKETHSRIEKTLPEKILSGFGSALKQLKF